MDHHFETEVLSIDCDTRHLSPSEAAARISRVMQSSHLRPSERILFKKVDSTLRGNIASELHTVLAERRASSPNRVVAIMAPAFPAGGRTTVDGQQLVHGIPLEKTEIWLRNDLSGVAHLPTMLGHAGLLTALLSLSIVRSPFANLVSSMIELAAAADVIVCDAETDDDLGAIAHASVALGGNTVWVGSAGLAYQLPHAAGLSAFTTSMQQPQFTSGPTLIVVGSMSSVSHRQARVLEHAVPVTSIRIPADILLEGHSRSALNVVAERIHESLKVGKRHSRRSRSEPDGGPWRAAMPHRRSPPSSRSLRFSGRLPLRHGRRDSSRYPRRLGRQFTPYARRSRTWLALFVWPYPRSHTPNTHESRGLRQSRHAGILLAILQQFGSHIQL